MLFILNAAGVPSHAKFVMLSGSVNQPPTASIVAPASNVTVNPGGSVTFPGTGSDSPGTQTVSFQVTEDDGATSAPVTRSVTVTNFSLSATPGSQTIAPGGSTSYSVTVSPQNGFTGDVSLAISGLPAAAIAALEDIGYVRRCVVRNTDDRQEFLNSAATRMSRVIDSHTNVVMLDTDRPATRVIDHFRRTALRSPAFSRTSPSTFGCRSTPEQMREFWRVWDLMPRQNKMSM
jgi:hypothetical protein